MYIYYINKIKIICTGILFNYKDVIHYDFTIGTILIKIDTLRRYLKTFFKIVYICLLQTKKKNKHILKM